MSAICSHTGSIELPEPSDVVAGCPDCLATGETPMPGSHLPIRRKDNVRELSNLKGMIPMIPYHIHADLASERRNTLLAEAEAFRLAKQARSHRQRAGTCAGRRGRAESRGRAAQNLAAGQARDLRKYAAAMRRSGMARRSQAGTRAGAALLRVISRPVRGKAGRAAGGQAGQAETGRRRWAVLAVVSAAQFLTILDLWVVNIALPALQHDFAPATLSDVSWILDVYAIVLAALLLPAGRAADSIGRRACFLAGLAVFGVASLGCAVAPDLPTLIACRALQAGGAAVLMPTSLGLALSVFPSHQRGTAVGVWAGVGAVAAGSGPVLGGLLVESSWRWIFLINLPVILATLAAGVAILPRRGNVRGNIHAGEGGSRRTGWRIDGVGTVLVLGAVGLVCTALTEAPGWPPSRTWPVLAAGLVLATAFVAHIRRHPDPLVAPRLFSVRPFSAGAVGLVAYYTGFAAMLLGTTLLLTAEWHFSVLHAAVSIAPGPITAGIVSPFSGRLSARFGIRSTVVAGAVLFAAAGAWPLASAGDGPAYAAVVLPSMLLWGLANALIQPSLFASADAAPPAELASGSAVLAMARQLGSALGVAVFVAVFGARPATGLAGFDRAWIVVLITAAMTAFAGLATGRQLSHVPAAAKADTAADALVASPAGPGPSGSAAWIRERECQPSGQ